MKKHAGKRGPKRPPYQYVLLLLALLCAGVIAALFTWQSPAFANEDARAKQIEIQRYRFVERLEPKLGFFPLWQSFDAGCTVLFPRGRSDRIYLLVRGAHTLSLKGGDNQLLCYQHKGSKDGLVYRINLQDKHAETGSPGVSLLGYLNISGYADGVNIPRLVRQDLAAKRDYAQYSYVPYNGVLRVSLLSNLKNGQPTGEEDYDAGSEDPKAFYVKYGLPLASGELAPIAGAGALAIPGVANETPRARQLAMERYQFVQRLRREANFHVWATTFTDDTAWFPIGRSDRVYLLCIGPYSNGPDDKNSWPYSPSNVILCYQHEDGRDKLVYKLPIINVLSPPTKQYPPKSLLEYITSQDGGESYVIGNQSINADGSLTIQNPITIYEYNDLSAQRNYVAYKDDWGNDCLEVYLLSDLKSQMPDDKEELGFEIDPITKAKIDEDVFYKRYGLPVVQEEEELIADGKEEK